YLGVAQGALATARDYTRTTSRPWLLSDSPSATADPYVLATYGRLVAATRAVEALADDVADHLDRADAAGDDLTWEARGELAEHVAALKVVSTDVALDVTNTIFEVTGARATSNKVGLDRFWRNVRTHTLHDPAAYKRREVGDHFRSGTSPEFALSTGSDGMTRRELGGRVWHNGGRRARRTCCSPRACSGSAPSWCCRS